MPRKYSDNSFNDGDVEMEDKEERKTVTIKKRKEVGNKKKRYLPVVPSHLEAFLNLCHIASCMGISNLYQILNHVKKNNDTM